MDGELAIGKKYQQLKNNNIIMATTVISCFELWQWDGLNAKEEQRLRDFLKTMIIRPFTQREAEIAGEIQKSLKKKGLEIQSEDSMIAGIALAQQEPLLTRNVKHFERIPGLRVETY